MLPVQVWYFLTVCNKNVMYEQNHPPQNLQNSGGSAWWGIGLTLLLHLLQIPMAILVIALSSDPYAFLIPLIFWGVSQLIYIIPALIIAYYAKKPHIVKGLLIGASISFLLNAACAGMFLMPTYL
jgi:hypothetical protein